MKELLFFFSFMLRVPSLDPDLFEINSPEISESIFLRRVVLSSNIVSSEKLNDER